MNLFDSIDLCVWLDPTSRGPSVRASLRLTAPDGDWKRDGGGRSWSWYGSAQALVRWLRDGGATMDGYYMGRILFDTLETWTFETTKDGAQVSGYHRAEFPDELARRLAGAIEFAALCLVSGYHDPGEYRRSEPVNVAGHCLAICNHYGTGKGKVSISYSSPEVEQRIAVLRQNRGDFAQCYDRIVSIALNGTASRDDCEPARFSADGDSFYWQTRSLCGGLIWHASAEEWSIHT